MNFDAAALAYVRYVLAELRMKPGALANKSGISASTLTRALNDPNHKFKLSMTTLEKIAGASGINPAPFLEAKDVAELSLGTAHRRDFYRPGSDNEPLNDHKITRTLLIGEIAAGRWLEPSPFPWHEWGSLGLTSTDVAPADAFAYVMRDDSADLIADNGDILFCTRLTDLSPEAIEKRRRHWHGGPVIVERRSKNAFKIETTLRVIRPKKRREPGWELLSACRRDYEISAAGKKPKIARVSIEQYTGDEEYKIIGSVEHVIRGDTTEAINWLTIDVP